MSDSGRVWGRANIMQVSVKWKDEVQAMRTVLAFQSGALKETLQLPFPDDIICIILCELHNSFFVPSFVHVMHRFLDGLCHENHPVKPRWISQQTAFARQNGMFMMIKVLCRHKRIALMHMQSIPGLLQSFSKKITELHELSQNKTTSKRHKKQHHELSGISMKWQKLENQFKLKVSKREA